MSNSNFHILIHADRADWVELEAFAWGNGVALFSQGAISL